MARLIWAEPALSDLDTVAEYISLENPDAARRLYRSNSTREVWPLTLARVESRVTNVAPNTCANAK